MFRGIIQKYLSLNIRTRTRNIFKDISVVAKCSYYMKHLETEAIACSFWNICSFSAINLLALCFYFAKSVQCDSLKSMQECAQSCPLWLCRRHTTKGADGRSTQPAPQLSGHGPNSHKVVCGQAKALCRTLLHSPGKEQYRCRPWDLEV